MATGQWLLVLAVAVACVGLGALVTYVLEEIRHADAREDRHA